MDEISLRNEAVTHLRNRVALLDLLVSVTALVREFYNKFSHLPVYFFFYRSKTLSAQSNIPASDTHC